MSEWVKEKRKEHQTGLSAPGDSLILSIPLFHGAWENHLGPSGPQFPQYDGRVNKQTQRVEGPRVNLGHDLTAAMGMGAAPSAPIFSRSFPVAAGRQCFLHLAP